ncbi:chitin-binding type-2 domain-containing protein [Trichonephila clavipes]|nr:chitin-binding type-2 domain-containing protein [Trichonephila clavipes]
MQPTSTQLQRVNERRGTQAKIVRIIANFSTEFLMDYFLSMDKLMTLFYLSLGVILPVATSSPLSAWAPQCPASTSGKIPRLIPDPTNCRRVFMCTHAGPRRYYCPVGQIFLGSEQKCVSKRACTEGHVVDIYELVCAGDCTCGDSHLELCRFAFGILTESITLFLELSCNLIVKKFDNLNVLARLHLGAEKELKWSNLDASLKS